MKILPDHMQEPTLRAGMLAALVLALSACASIPSTVSHKERTAIRRVGIVSLMENEMHAYFKVGPVLRERVGASVREDYLGPSVLGGWRVNRKVTEAVSEALAPRYRYVALDYDPGRLERKAYQADPNHLNLAHIKNDLRRISAGKVDTLIIVSTSGSLSRVVGRKVWLAGYGFFRQSILPGHATVDYAALRMSVIDAKTLQPVADRSAFSSRHLPTSLWDIQVTSITPPQKKSLRKHVAALLRETVQDLVQDMGLGKQSGS